MHYVVMNSSLISGSYEVYNGLTSVNMFIRVVNSSSYCIPGVIVAGCLAESSHK
jgi:hypothetical protein